MAEEKDIFEEARETSTGALLLGILLFWGIAAILLHSLFFEETTGLPPGRGAPILDLIANSLGWLFLAGMLFCGYACFAEVRRRRRLDKRIERLDEESNDETSQGQE